MVIPVAALALWCVPMGLVVTNRHVVDDASTVTVRMNASDGQRLELTGRVLGRGILADLAVIQLDSNRTFATLPLGDSDVVAQGDEITAWGYPLGSFLGTDPTLTRGIISSTNRVFEDTDYLQTDASIAPGNSGGPVVDLGLAVSLASTPPDWCRSRKTALGSPCRGYISP